MAKSRDGQVVQAVRGYIDGVSDGSLVVGKTVRQAVERHVRDLEDGEARGLCFDHKAAVRAIRFFEFLTHSKGEWAGRTFELAPWQAFIQWSLFGWKRLEDGYRRFRTAYTEVCRKNGKSSEAAGVGLYMLVADGEPGAEIYTAATKRDQARISHGEAVRMVKASPSLRRMVRVFKDNLSVEATHSKFVPLGGDTDSTDGLNPHAVIIDELHAHKTRAMFDVMDTATGARRQPLLFCITTAGYDRQSVCRQQHDYCRKVLDGVIQDDTTFAFIAAIDEGDEWDDEECWIKANPNLGISVKLDDLRRKAAKAREMPTALNAFLQLHLGVWTEQAVRWLPMDKWDACGAVVNARSLQGRRCFAGLDLASTTDLAALVLVFPSDDGYDALPFFWCPGENARKREKRDRVPYVTWAADGLIEMTPGESIDYRFIRRRIKELGQQYQVQEIAFDPYNATQLATQLGEEDGFQMVQFRQGALSMNEPCKELERLIATGQLHHGGNPVLRWMASNVTVKTDPAGNIRPDKQNSSEKIDGIVALVMAIGRGMLKTEELSIYDLRAARGEPVLLTL